MWSTMTRKAWKEGSWSRQPEHEVTGYIVFALESVELDWEADLAHNPQALSLRPDNAFQLGPMSKCFHSFQGQCTSHENSV